MKTKRAKVIMLPTNKGIILNTRCEPQGKGHIYIITDEEIKEGDWYVKYIINKNYPNYSVIPDSIIKADLNKTNEFLIEPYSKYCKKIIATTDKSLVYNHTDTYEVQSVKMEGSHHKELPQPSQAFIEKYCKVGGIYEVLVEYEKDTFIHTNGMAFGVKVKGNIKVNSDNTINIFPVKNSWSREEVEKLCRNAMFTGELLGKNPLTPTPLGKDFDEISGNWIKQNL